MPDDLITGLTFAGPERRFDGGSRPTLILRGRRGSVEDGWPAKVVLLLDTFYLKCVQPFGGIYPFVDMEGRRRDKAAVLGSLRTTLRHWMPDVEGAGSRHGRPCATDLRDIGVQQLIYRSDMQPAQIAHAAGYLDEISFMLRFKPLYENKARKG